MSTTTWLECDKCHKNYGLGTIHAEHNGELNIKLKYYSNNSIRPTDEVPWAKTKRLYCEECNEFTLWFLGEGAADHRLIIDLDLKKHYLEENNKALVEAKEKSANSGKLYNFFKGKSRISSLESQIEANKVAIEEINYEIENSEDIKFYKKLNPDIKCLECGNSEKEITDKLTSPTHKFVDPSSNCDGNIEIKSKPSNIHFNYSFAKYIVYDSYGNVVDRKDEIPKLTDTITETVEKIKKWQPKQKF